MQGDSKEVGAKVVYKGREMIVSKGVDGHGDMKMIDLSGVVALSEALKTNLTLHTLGCAAAHPILCSQELLTLGMHPHSQSARQWHQCGGRQAPLRLSLIHI